MSLPVAFGSVVFLCVLTGGLLGTFLRTALPERHLGAESRDLVRLTIDQPFEGLVRVSTAPLRDALLQLGR